MGVKNEDDYGQEKTYNISEYGIAFNQNNVTENYNDNRQDRAYDIARSDEEYSRDGSNKTTGIYDDSSVEVTTYNPSDGDYYVTESYDDYQKEEPANFKSEDYYY